jgi:hypothetical protein
VARQGGRVERRRKRRRKKRHMSRVQVAELSVSFCRFLFREEVGN